MDQQIATLGIMLTASGISLRLPLASELSPPVTSVHRVRCMGEDRDRILDPCCNRGNPLCSEISIDRAATHARRAVEIDTAKAEPRAERDTAFVEKTSRGSTRCCLSYAILDLH
jgi:hypothetical protein